MRSSGIYTSKDPIYSHKKPDNRFSSPKFDLDVLIYALKKKVEIPLDLIGEKEDCRNSKVFSNGLKRLV